MRLRERETMTPEIERELEALDAALAGRAVPDDPALPEFVRELRAERPEPEQPFAAELDARAAEGFGGSGAESPFGRLGRWLSAKQPRQILAPAGAAVTLLVVVGVAISQSGIVGDDGSRGEGPIADAPTATEPAVTEEPPGGVQGTAESLEIAPGDTPTEDFGAQQAPNVLPNYSNDSDSTLKAPPNPPAPNRNGLVPGQDDRKVEQAAQLTLSTEPDDVPGVADDVIDVTDRYSGIVVSSQVSGSADDSSVARFDLAIPATELQSALADLSELADVKARSESTLDITEPFVAAREQLADARAELESLLTQLADADTPNETASIRARIDIVRGEIAGARSQVEDLGRRARFARVSVTVEGDGGSAGWSLGDAADDAVDVLRTVAGVALVSLAVLAPLAVLGAIGWIVARGAARRRRERALD